MKVWLVEFPIYQYKEDVKELAKKHGLKVIDSRYSKDIKPEFVIKETPPLTKKSATQLKKEGN